MKPTYHQEFRDAMQANLGYAEKQTSHIEAEVYQIQYPELDYASLVPVDTSAADWATSVTFYSMDQVGAAQWISGNAKDIPVVGLSSEQFESAVYMAGVGYDYSMQEMEQARLLGRSLDSMKAAAARRAYEEFTYKVALIGNTEKGFEGLFNTTGIVTNTEGARLNTLTPDQILAKLNAELIGIVESTKTVGMADTQLVPVDLYLYMASTPRSSTSDTTILDYYLRTNVYTAQTGRPLDFRMHRLLNDAGAGATTRMVSYRKSPEVVKLHIPMMHRFLPVQIQGLSFMVPGIFRLGGTDIRLPGECRYLDGV